MSPDKITEKKIVDHPTAAIPEKEKRKKRRIMISVISLASIGIVVGITFFVLSFIDYEISLDARKLAAISCRMKCINEKIKTVANQPQKVIELQKNYDALQNEYYKLGKEIEKKYSKDKMRQEEFYEIFKDVLEKCDCSKYLKQEEETENKM